MGAYKYLLFSTYSFPTFFFSVSRLISGGYLRIPDTPKRHERSSPPVLKIFLACWESELHTLGVNRAKTQRGVLYIGRMIQYCA